MSQAEELHALIEPLVVAEGLELFDVEVLPRVVRVAVDRPEGGVDLDSISDLTTAISSLLDAHDPLPGSYALEVSSPGLERPLRTPAHFRRFAGTTVSVKTKPEVEGERRVEGTLSDVDDSGFTILVGGEKGDGVNGRRFSYDEVEKARTVFEWGPPPKPGKVGGRPAKKKAERAS
jgi:ribosome maturation factor RimP